MKQSSFMHLFYKTSLIIHFTQTSIITLERGEVLDPGNYKVMKFISIIQTLQIQLVMTNATNLVILCIHIPLLEQGWIHRNIGFES